MKRLPALFALVALFAVPALAQTSVAMRIDTAVAMKQIVRKIDPVMPPIAAAARVTGTVTADVTVGVSGAAESITFIQRNALFELAAETALKQWTFKPFVVDGRPSRVVFLVDLQFGTPVPDRDRQIRDSYFTNERECQRQTELRAPAAERACGELATVSGIVCRGTGCASLTPARLVDLLTVVPSGQRVWMVSVSEALTEPFASAVAYLEPGSTSGPLGRGPVGLITRPRGEPGKDRPTTGWAYGPLAGSWGQVVPAGTDARVFTAPDDPALPFEIYDAADGRQLSDADVVAIVTRVREAGAATKKAARPAPRLFTDVQPWRINDMTFFGAGTSEVLVRLIGPDVGDTQRVHVKRVNGEFVIEVVER